MEEKLCLLATQGISLEEVLLVNSMQVYIDNHIKLEEILDHTLLLLEF